MTKFKDNLKHLFASWLRAIASMVGGLQFVVHAGGVSISGGWQVLGALVGSLVAPVALFLTTTADDIDGA